MHFSHADDIWAAYPNLRPLVCRIRGLSAAAEAAPQIQHLMARARTRLTVGPVSALPSLRAWRDVLADPPASDGPVCCRAEELLQALAHSAQAPQPQHPLADLCQALSMAYAMPVAVYDCAAIVDPLRTARVTGHDTLHDDTGCAQPPCVGEVIVSDGDGHVHARHWCRRYSPRSALKPSATDVLIVAEGLHEAAQDELASLRADLAMAVRGLWGCRVESRVLTRSNPVFAF